MTTAPEQTSAETGWSQYNQIAAAWENTDRKRAEHRREAKRRASTPGAHTFDGVYDTPQVFAGDVCVGDPSCERAVLRDGLCSRHAMRARSA